ncbi:MAG: metal ABC transporter substrate-binding protein [Propionicimonas sp.]
MFLRKVGSAVAIASLLLVSACAGPVDPTADDAGRLTVATAFYPFEFIAERVGGDQVAVSNLTQPGSEPHDLELTPRQVAALATDDLVVYQSGFQPAVDAAVEQAAPRRVVDAASFLTFLPAAVTGATTTAALDPHTWQDPTTMIAVAEQVRDALIAARPEAKAEFTANTEALVKDLTALDTDFSTGLARCERTTFITSHAAFGYLAARYHLTQVGIRGLEPDVEPSAARIAEVQQLARAGGITTIFFETLVSPVVSDSIAADLGLRTDVLDPLEGITAESRGTTYLEVMRSNLASLRTANQCS